MKRNTLLIAIVIFLAFSILGYYLLKPYVNIAVTQDLVGPEDESLWILLESGATVSRIEQELDGIGKDINDYHGFSGSLLATAVEKNRLDLARWLLSEGIDPNGSGYQPTPLWIAVSMTRDPKMVRLLLDSGADPMTDYGDGLTIRKIAEYNNSQEIVAIIDEYLDNTPSESSNIHP